MRQWLYRVIQVALQSSPSWENPNPMCLSNSIPSIPNQMFDASQQCPAILFSEEIHMLPACWGDLFYILVLYMYPVQILQRGTRHYFLEEQRVYPTHHPIFFHAEVLVALSNVAQRTKHN